MYCSQNTILYHLFTIKRKKKHVNNFHLSCKRIVLTLAFGVHLFRLVSFGVFGMNYWSCAIVSRRVHLRHHIKHIVSGLFNKRHNKRFMFLLHASFSSLCCEGGRHTLNGNSAKFPFDFHLPETIATDLYAAFFYTFFFTLFCGMYYIIFFYS